LVKSKTLFIEETKMEMKISVLALLTSTLVIGGCLSVPMLKGDLLNMETGDKMVVTLQHDPRLDHSEGTITVALPTGEVLAGLYKWGDIAGASSSISAGGMITGGTISPIVMSNPSGGNFNFVLHGLFVALKSKSGVIGIRCRGNYFHYGECEGLINGKLKYRGTINER
jgi:hypothetical protein